MDWTAGGVLMMWDRRALEKVEVMVGKFSVSVRWQGMGMVLFRYVLGFRTRMIIT